MSAFLFLGDKRRSESTESLFVLTRGGDVMGAMMKVKLISADAGIVLNDLPAIIGRNRTADVCLDDADTGEFQCIIEQDDGGLSVADIAGGLGTFVNGHRITRAALMPGDRLDVGRSNFTVQYEL
jgi:pSer/pThr/pTyr-binding forkhead associated (FHA) protein